MDVFPKWLLVVLGSTIILMLPLSDRVIPIVIGNILKFLHSQKERVEKKEITASTLRNYAKTIKMFCEVTDIIIQWEKITRVLPRGKRYADDRAPTLDEIHKIIEYPDRRIKPIVYTMASSGIRVGAWDHLKWSHVSPIIRDSKYLLQKKLTYILARMMNISRS
jgi:integrase